MYSCIHALCPNRCDKSLIGMHGWSRWKHGLIHRKAALVLQNGALNWQHFLNPSLARQSCRREHHESNEDKKQHEWEHNQEPRNGGVAGATHQIQNPGPKQDIKRFAKYDGSRAGDVA